jgi:hypothetical protein
VPRRSPFVSWRAAVPAALVLVLAAGTAPAAASPAAGTSIVGTVRVLAVDPVPGTTQPEPDEYVTVLVTADDAIVLAGAGAAELEPNTTARVSGALEDGELAVTSSEVIEQPEVADLATNGATHTLLMLVTWPGLAPDDVTQASAAEQMFTDTDAWLRDASYGEVGVTGDATPWLTIAGPEGNRCHSDHDAIMDQAKTAAAASGYTLSGYQNFVVYFPWAGDLPGADCGGAAGWAYIDYTGVWLNGYLDRRVTTHELGHNFGLYHSHSYLCPGGGVVGDGACEFLDYGDDFDAMGGSSFVGNFNASQKSLLGWMDGRSVDLTAGGRATLAPMSTQAVTTQAAYVSVSGTRTYWLEYRQPTGADEWMGENGTNGVLVRVRDDALLRGAAGDPSSWDTGTGLLDVRPADGVARWSATLLGGQSWTTPEGMTIAVGGVTASGAEVTVLRDAAAPSAPRNVKATPGDGRATVTWDPPADPGGSAISSYRVTASPGGAAVTVNGASRSATVAGLTNGQWYRFSVAATNNQTSGPGGASPQIQVGDFVAPAVTARTPAVSARTVPVAGNVTVRFDEAVINVNPSGFRLLTPSRTVVPAKVTWNAATRTATLDPVSALASRTRYTAEIRPWSLYDAQYNYVAATSWTFLTGPAPVVSTRGPASNATAVAVGANVTTVFSTPVAGVSGTTVRLSAPNGTVVPARVTYNATTRTATLDPTRSLAADTRYTVRLTGGTTAIRDTAGNPLAGTSWSFLTGAAPAVSARVPASGATGVSVSANLTVRFTEPVAGVSAGSFQVRTSTGAVVAATVRYSPSTRTATLDPKVDLARGQRYTVTVTGGASAVRDVAGNPLPRTTWSFRTR